jgi:NADH-quinone oxidoreductase subunit K
MMALMTVSGALVQAAAASATTVKPPVPLHWFIGISIILFFFGLVIVLTRRNLIYVLMGVELILNAASLNFVAFSAFRGKEALIDGTIMGAFIIVLAAAEAAIALAIVLRVFDEFRSVRPEDPDLLRE